MGEMQRYTGRILAVGISDNRETKKHSCGGDIVAALVISNGYDSEKRALTTLIW